MKFIIFQSIGDKKVHSERLFFRKTVEQTDFNNLMCLRANRHYSVLNSFQIVCIYIVVRLMDQK